MEAAVAPEQSCVVLEMKRSKVKAVRKRKSIIVSESFTTFVLQKVIEICVSKLKSCERSSRTTEKLSNAYKLKQYSIFV